MGDSSRLDQKPAAIRPSNSIPDGFIPVLGQDEDTRHVTMMRNGRRGGRKQDGQLTITMVPVLEFDDGDYEEIDRGVTWPD